MSVSRRRFVILLSLIVAGGCIAAASSARGLAAARPAAHVAEPAAQQTAWAQASKGPSSFRVDDVPNGLTVLDSHVAPSEIPGTQSEVLTMARPAPDQALTPEADAGSVDAEVSPQVTVRVTRAKAAASSELLTKIRRVYTKGSEVSTSKGAGYLYEVHSGWRSLYLQRDGAVVEVSGVRVSDAELVSIAESVEVPK